MWIRGRAGVDAGRTEKSSGDKEGRFVIYSRNRTNWSWKQTNKKMSRVKKGEEWRVASRLLI